MGSLHGERGGCPFLIRCVTFETSISLFAHLKHLLLTGLLLASAGTAFAQGARPAVLDVNNYRGDVFPSTQLWRNYFSLTQPQPSGGLEIPKSLVPGQPRLLSSYIAGLWIGGQDTTTRLYVAAETYRQGTIPDRGFWTGPASQAATAGMRDNPAYDSVWSVTRAEINTHRAQYAQPGYVMARTISAWPGHVPGTTPVERLAPFADLNGNNRYEPALGEYPDVPGDQAMFYVCNDMAGNKVPFSPRMEIDIHGLVYAFAGSGPTDPLANTAFVRYTVHNRSTRTYQDLYIGHWTDFDLGNWNDDYMATDRNRRMMYVYNGDIFDEDDSTTVPPTAGYGANPPTQGVMLLSDSVASATYYNNDFSPQGNPSQAIHYYNYLRGRWLNGQLIEYGGDGAAGTNRQPYPWMYDGDPVTGTGWTEAGAGRIPGDRRGVISAGPYTLASGAARVFEIAYVFARGAGGSAAPQLASVAGLQQTADQIQIRYQSGTLAAPRALETAAILTLAPNPATRTATIHAGLPAGLSAATLTLRDALGRTVRTVAVRAATTPLDVRGLAGGLYHATLTAPDGRALARQRLVVTAE